MSDMPHQAPLTGSELIASLHDINHLRWRPPPDSMGSLLVERDDRRSEHERQRALTTFVRQALAAEGMWWLIAIYSPPDALTETDFQRVIDAWDQMADGGRPFKSNRAI